MKPKIILSLLFNILVQNILSNTSQTTTNKSSPNLKTKSNVNTSKKTVTSAHTSSSDSKSTKSSKSQSNSKKTKKLAHTELDYYDKDIEQKIQKLPTLAEKLIAQAHLKSIRRSNSTLKK